MRGKRALLRSTVKNVSKTKQELEDAYIENAIRDLGSTMRAVEKSNRDTFNRFKTKCKHRKPYEPDPRLIMCKERKHTWHAWPCKMEECPLLKGEI